MHANPQKSRFAATHQCHDVDGGALVPVGIDENTAVASISDRLHLVKMFGKKQ